MKELVTRKIGTDGAYSRVTHTLTPTDRPDVFTLAIQSPLITYDGAEQRPIAAAPERAPQRSAWPSTLAFGAIVLALDHGNVGAALLVALWWASWAVAR